MVLRKLVSLGLFIVLLSVSSYSRRPGIIQKHEIRPLDMPYVTLYEHENFRGVYFTQVLGKAGCQNLPEERSNWTSSIDTHKRCVDLCTGENCGGRCYRIEPNTAPTRRLSKISLNDSINSLKSCYT